MRGANIGPYNFVGANPVSRLSVAFVFLSRRRESMMDTPGASLTCLAILVTALAARAQNDQPMGQITIDSGQKFQEIQGFGVNYTGPCFRDDQKPMFDKLIDDLGVTMFRVVPYLVYSNWEETPGQENSEHWNNRYSTAIFEGTWNGVRYLNFRGIRPVLALMGPVPTWMTDRAPAPRHKVCQENVAPSLQGHLSPAHHDDFAEEVVSMVEYTRTQAHIEYFSPFNETDCYPPEGPRIDPDEAPNVLLAVARKLRKEGFGDARLAVPDNAVITNDYTDPILKEDELMNQVRAFTFHTYGENSVGPQVEHVKSSKYSQVPVWLTEYGDLNDRDKSFEKSMEELFSCSQ